MLIDEDNFSFNEIIRQIVTRHLSVKSNWYGNPKDSSFGIYLDLCWDGNPFGTTMIDFFDENSNKNL